MSPINALGGVLAAGALATVAFDAFGQSLSPLFGYPRLAPVGLANGLLKALTGAGSNAMAEGMHYLIGLIGYPLGWILVAGPAHRAIAPGIPLLIAAALYGIALWAVALYVIGHLIVGNPPFLNFGPLSWVAFVGHIVYAVVFVASYRWIRAARW
ncbi:MAG: hypothetical protein AAF909_05100 [Pseudomonadota bacterium]